MGQFYAVTGSRRPNTEVAQINARTPYLTSKKRLLEEKEYREDMLGLEQDALEQDAEQFAASQALSKDAIAAEADDRKRSNVIAAGKLASDIYFGNKNAGALEALYSGDGKASSADTVEMVKGSDGAYVPDDFFTSEGAGSLSSWVKPLSELKTYASGLGGAVLSGAAGDLIGEATGIEDEGARRALGGAAVGGVSNYLSGGSVYGAIASAAMGGLLGWGSSEGGWF